MTTLLSIFSESPQLHYFKLFDQFLRNWTFCHTNIHFSQTPHLLFLFRDCIFHRFWRLWDEKWTTPMPILLDFWRRCDSWHKIHKYIDFVVLKFSQIKWLCHLFNLTLQWGFSFIFSFHHFYLVFCLPKCSKVSWDFKRTLLCYFFTNKQLARIFRDYILPYKVTLLFLSFVQNLGKVDKVLNRIWMFVIRCKIHMQ